MAAKRADYFVAGTLVVWDVDPIAVRVHAYRAGVSDPPTTFAIGQDADAEPALEGWRMPVARRSPLALIHPGITRKIAHRAASSRRTSRGEEDGRLACFVMSRTGRNQARSEPPRVSPGVRPREALA